MTSLHSRRLELRALELEAVDAALAGERDRLAAALGVEIPEGWPEPIVRERALPMVRRRLALDPTTAVWGLWAVVLDGGVVGGVSLKGPPDPRGIVEIGYGILGPWRRRGIATEAASALVDWVRRQAGVRRVTAQCEPTNVGSIRVLEGIGMRQVGRSSGLLTWVLPDSGDGAGSPPEAADGGLRRP